MARRSLHPAERLARLTGPQLRLVVPCFVSLVLVGIGIRLLGYRRTRAILVRFARDATQEASSPNAQATAERVAWVLGGVVRHGPYKATCLPRSVTLWWLLLRRGIRGDLRFGAQRADQGIRAHAWVELDGAPLNDEEGVTERYPPFGALAGTHRRE